MQTDQFIMEILKMMYQFSQGDTVTLDKFKVSSNKERKSRNKSLDSRPRSISQPRNTSIVNKEKEELSADINPKLSIDDTPVSGVKILKPGQRYPSRPRTVDFEGNPRDESISNQRSVSRKKQHQEVRFSVKTKGQSNSQDEMCIENNREERDSIKHSGRKEVKEESFKSHKDNKITIMPKERISSSDKKLSRDRISHRVSQAKSTDRIKIDKWMLSNMNKKERSKREMGSSREFSKSRDKISNLDKELIRNDSIKRIQKITLSTNKSEQSRDFHGNNLRVPSKKELVGKFACLRERRKRERSTKESSRNKFGTESSKPHTQAFNDEHYKEKYITELDIDQMNSSKIKALHEWVKELGYLKYYSLEKDLPDECKNGSFLFKLINHLERKDVLKGENTSNRTAVKVNFDKVFNHLKKFEKFNPRYLGGMYFLINGNKDVFWGLLDDIRLVYGNKISRRDRRFKKVNNIKDQTEEEEICDFTYSLSDNNTRSHSRKTDKRRHSFDVKGIYISKSAAKETYNNLRRKSSPRTSPEVMKQEYSSKYLQANKANLVDDRNPLNKCRESVRVTRTNGRFVDFENTSKPQLKKLKLDYKNLADLEGDCRVWFDSLKLKVNYKDSVFENQLRNGYLLCFLCSMVFHRKLRNVCKEPKTINECRNNVENALNVLRSMATAIPYELLWQADEVLKGNPAVIWPLFSSIKFLHETASADNSDCNLNRGTPISSVNIKTLPYTCIQIEMLENSLLNWMIGLGVFNQDPRLPTSFDEVVDPIGQGYLLYKVVNSVTGVSLRGLHSRPMSTSNCMHNVRKSLEALLAVKDMSRKFLWKVEDIVNKDRLCIVGLLEDLHRLHSGLPKRKDPGYFGDGPYIVVGHQTDESKQFEEKGCIERNQQKKSKMAAAASIETAKDSQPLDPLLSNHFRIRESDRTPAIKTKDLVKMIINKPCSKLQSPTINQDCFNSQPQRTTRSTDCRDDEANKNISLLDKIEQNYVNRVDGSPSEEGRQFLPIDQVKKVIKLLLLLNMPRIVERESWDSEVWTLFSDGYKLLIQVGVGSYDRKT